VLLVPYQPEQRHKVVVVVAAVDDVDADVDVVNDDAVVAVVAVAVAPNEQQQQHCDNDAPQLLPVLHCTEKRSMWSMCWWLPVWSDVVEC